MIKKAVIPVAGYGTRMLPATLSIPKTMLNVLDKPVIEYIIEEIKEAGITDILLITNSGSDLLEKQFSRNFELESFLNDNKEIETVNYLKDRFKHINIYLKKASTNTSLAETILDAKSFVNDEPFLLVLGDEIFSASCSKLLVDKYNELKAPIIAVKKVDKTKISNYGIIEGKEYKKNLCIIEKMFEKPKNGETESNTAIIGRYILTPSVFEKIENQIESGDTPNFTKALQHMKEIKFALNINLDRYDCGNKLGLLIANIEMGLKRDEFSQDLKLYLQNLVDNI